MENHGPIFLGFAGTMFTWFCTAVGAGFVFFMPNNLSESVEGKVLDFSLGFAGGVMTAASFWSLLDPALELADEKWSSLSFVPVVFGLLLGSLFVYISDALLPEEMDLLSASSKLLSDRRPERNGSSHKKSPSRSKSPKKNLNKKPKIKNASEIAASQKRILLLIIAVVIHNFPEGLAVGVGFGAIGSMKGATFEKACSIAIGIGLQNAPEGLAVSLPLRRLGFSRRSSFFYGQLSGMVEPLGGVLGAAAVTLVQATLPYILAFAAGAMLYVVVDSVIPESHSRGNNRLASWGFITGFIVMMSLDVALTD